MDADLGQLLDAARSDARRRRHDFAGPEHLLAAILDEELVSKALVRRGLDPVELRARLDARLSARSTVGGYRDGTDAPLSPCLERVVERLTLPGPLHVGGCPTVFDALLLEPWIASLVVGLRHGEKAVRLVEQAIALAVVHGHIEADVEHVMACLVNEPFFAAAVRTIGGDHTRLRSAVHDALAAHVLAPEERLRPTLCATLEQAFAPLLSIRRFSVVLSRQRQVSRFLLAAAQIDAFALVYAVTHGLPPPSDAPIRASNAPVDVVLHHDDVTSPGEVVDVLESAFDLLPADAWETASVLRTTGSAVVGTLPLKEADLRRSRAFAHLRRHCVPLRMSLRQR